MKGARYLDLDACDRGKQSRVEGHAVAEAGGQAVAGIQAIASGAVVPLRYGLTDAAAIPTRT